MMKKTIAIVGVEEDGQIREAVYVNTPHHLPPQATSASKENFGVALDFAKLALEKFGKENLRLIAVTGSTATGKAKKESDIDMMIVRLFDCLCTKEPQDCAVLYELIKNSRYEKIAPDCAGEFCDLGDRGLGPCIREDVFYGLFEPDTDLSRIQGGIETIRTALRDAIALYENPKGYLEKVKERYL